MSATVPANLPRPLPAAGRYIGRVGALAIALGIGTAVAGTPWVASADDSASTATSADSTSADSSTPRAGNQAPTRRATRVQAEQAAGTRRAPAAGGLPVAAAAVVAAAQRGAGNDSPVPAKRSTSLVRPAPVDVSDPVRVIPAPGPQATAPAAAAPA